MATSSQIIVDYTRGRCRHFPKKFFRAVEKHVMFSVSLSEWLGRSHILTMYTNCSNLFYEHHLG